MTSVERQRSTRNTWTHFTKIGKAKGKCHHCQAVISIAGGSTSNLLRHLRLRHTQLVTKDRNSGTIGIYSESNTSEDLHTSHFQEQKLLLRCNDAYSSIGSTSGSILTPGSGPSSNGASFPVHVLGQEFEGVIKSVPLSKKQAIDLQLLKVICKEYHSLSILKEEEFVKLVQLLCPSYSLPSCKTLLNNLLPCFYNDVIPKIMMQLENAQAVCLTCDSWMSFNDVIVYAVTAHYLNGETVLQSSLLECEEFSREEKMTKISDWLEYLTKKFNINSKICAIVTNNMPELTIAINNLKWAENRHVFCYANTLNLIVHRTIKNNIGNYIQKINSIVDSIEKNYVAQSKLQEIQNQENNPALKLKRDIPALWPTTLEMLKRVLSIKETIQTELELLNLELSVEWDIIDHAVKLMSVFSEVIAELCSEKNVSLAKTCIFSRVIMKRVRSYLDTENIPEPVKKLCEELSDELLKNFGTREKIELVAESIFFDPRFKKQGFGEEDTFNTTYQNLINKVRFRIISSMQLSQSDELPDASSSIWYEFDSTALKVDTKNDPSGSAVFQLDKYLAEPLLSRSSDPLLWWEERKTIYPSLYNIMVQRLCIPATSVPCKDIFSKDGYINNERRRRLPSKKIKQILFINSKLNS